MNHSIRRVAPGIWRIRFGTPERRTPVALRAVGPDRAGLAALPAVATPPFAADALRFTRTARGCIVEIPMGDGEQVYGFGLQLKSLNQTAKKRTVRVNSDPIADTGDSHAPAPFYASTAGYGVLIDTLRYALVNTGSHVKVGQGTPAVGGSVPSGQVSELYKARRLKGRYCVVDIPAAKGVDVYVFGGPDLRGAVQRYNLFSGGGCLPPMWGLGVWYRGSTHHSADALLKLAGGLRAERIPCDVFGLEPGWQSQAYSCSYRWSPDRFPDPDGFLARLHALGFRSNLWEHVFVHPSAELYEPLKPLSADYEVWGGLIPDLSLPKARALYAGYHARAFIDKGVSGFKCDECDNADMTPWFWSFPEAAAFPGGMDGEQMHSALGLLYQQTLLQPFRARNRRTLSQVRASHALAAPYPFVLYSDLYDHRDFVRGVTTAGFAGLLWSPEVRDAKSVEDLLRRIQSVALSPQALVNAWYIAHPPWRQVDMDKNNRGEFQADATAVTDSVRRIFELRMALLPYLYAAFARYRREGIPVCRALVMDYPQDAQTHNVDDQWLLGESLLVAPMFVGQTERKVYLPAGAWRCFHSGAAYAGGQAHTVAADLNTIPLFVKEGTILPLAAPVQHVAPDTVFAITAQVWGEPSAPCVLEEDDFETFDYERGVCNQVILSWKRGKGRVRRHGAYRGRRYRVVAWEQR